MLEVYRSRFGAPPSAASLEPVILFPGLAGSGLEAEIDKNYKPAWNCFKEWSWWGIWINLYEALAQTCWFDNLNIRYFVHNNSYVDNPGVKIKARDFGGLNGVNKLDHFDDPFGLTDYYQPIIESLESIGYSAGVNLFGAPYDWRLPVDYLMRTDALGTNHTYEEDVRMLIERAYQSAGNKKVHLVTHSMGGPTVLYFLNHQTTEWRATYIASYIPIAGPFAGTLKALKSQISGDSLIGRIPILDISLLSEKDIARNMRSSGGAAYLAPDADYYGDQVFVTNTARNQTYTSAQLGEMWNDIGAPNTAALWNRTKDLISDLRGPQVKSYCLYGYGIETEIHLTYDKDWPSNPLDVNQPEVDYSDLGDGTVPLFSLVECKSWLTEETDVNCKEYHLTDHTEILKDEELHVDLLAIVTGQSPIKGCAETPQFDKSVEEMKKYR